VSHNVVHRNAAWETNASLHLLRLLVLEGLLNFCFDKRINSLANSVDVSSFHAQTSSLLERLVSDQRCCLKLVENGGVFNEVLLLLLFFFALGLLCVRFNHN